MSWENEHFSLPMWVITVEAAQGAERFPKQKSLKFNFSMKLI